MKRYFKVLVRGSLGFQVSFKGMTLEFIKDCPELEGIMLKQPGRDANGRLAVGTVTMDYASCEEVFLGKEDCRPVDTEMFKVDRYKLVCECHETLLLTVSDMFTAIQMADSAGWKSLGGQPLCPACIPLSRKDKENQDERTT